MFYVKKGGYFNGFYDDHTPESLRSFLDQEFAPSCPIRQEKMTQLVEQLFEGIGSRVQHPLSLEAHLDILRVLQAWSMTAKGLKFPSWSGLGPEGGVGHIHLK